MPGIDRSILSRFDHLRPDYLDGCPVEPLGCYQDWFFYRDQRGQRRALRAREHKRLQILSLFGDQVALLQQLWPQLDGQGRIEGWRPDLAAETLMGVAAAKGVVDPERLGFPVVYRGLARVRLQRHAG